MTEIEVNPVSQHVLLFLLISLTSGSLFCWVVLENHFALMDMPGAKYNGYGYLVSLLGFVLSGVVLHARLLSVMMKRISFMAAMYLAVSIFCIGLVLIVLGGMYVPELLFVAALCISYAGAQLHVMHYLLFTYFRYHPLIMSVAFTLSSMLFQFVSLPVPFYSVFVVWILAIVAVTVFYKPKMPKTFKIQTSSMKNMTLVLKNVKLYPIFANVFFGCAAKSFYQNCYFRRLEMLGIPTESMEYVYTAANFSAVLAGFFNLLKLQQSHVITALMGIVYYILILASQNTWAIGASLFLMNISMTGVTTSSLSLCNATSVFEANSMTYLMLMLGDIVGLTVSLVSDIFLIDKIIMPMALAGSGIAIAIQIFQWPAEILGCKQKESNQKAPENESGAELGASAFSEEDALLVK